MAFTNDVTTTIGKVRLYSGDADEGTHVFEDDAVERFITDAGGIVMLAAYKLVRAKMAHLAALPTSQSMSTYSQSMDFSALQKVAEVLKTDLEAEGIGIDGEDVAQFGMAEQARTRKTWMKTEYNKAARGETC